MVGSADPQAVVTFFAPEALRPGDSLTLGDDEAHHARVLRLGIGARVRLTNGAGTKADAVLRRLSKDQALLDIETTTVVPEALWPVHLMVPVADRDRMLWLAEKAVELGAASWRPILWRRSRSVTGRGVGTTFQHKVLARMRAALTQSGGAWLPAVHPEAPLDRALAAAPVGTRVVLDPDGEPIAGVSLLAPVTLAVGPEGGIESAELAEMAAAGFTGASLAGSILRFETAGVAALAVVRARLMLEEATHG